MKPLRTMLATGVLLLSCCASPQTPEPHYDPAPTRHNGSQKSFVDFAFSRINPQNIDYGERIEGWRQGMLDSTVRDYGFWADAFAMAMLGMAFVLIYWQHRQNQNVRFHTARLLTVYHSELAQARIHGEQLQSEYEHLKRSAAQQSEETLLAKQPAAKRDNPAAKNSGSLTQLLQNSGGASGTEQQLRDQTEKLNQQLAAANRTVGNLRQQVSTLTQKLEDEQQRNRKLRGE